MNIKKKREEHFLECIRDKKTMPWFGPRLNSIET